MATHSVTRITLTWLVYALVLSTPAAAATGGDIDTSFQPRPGTPDVYAVTLQPDGKILIIGTNDLSPSSNLVRLNADGSIDGSFHPGVFWQVYPQAAAIALQPDGKAIFGGGGLVSPYHLGRFNTDGTTDSTFTPFLLSRSPNSPTVNSLALQTDGRLLLGGGFDSVGVHTQRCIARLLSNGAWDPFWGRDGVAGGSPPVVYATILQPDGKALIAGDFTFVLSGTRNRVARLLPQGSLDSSFQNGMSGIEYPTSIPRVHALALQSDGKVLVGGFFNTVNGVARNCLARLNEDGSLDASFSDPGFVAGSATCYSVVVQPDGKIVVGGDFISVAGQSRNRIARLNGDGSLDTTFEQGMAGADAPVDSVALQPDGRVVIVGTFATVNGASYPGIARLYADAPTPLSIVREPSGEDSYAGCCAIFRVSASGAPRDYRWRKDGIDLVDGGNVSGADTATLTLTGLTVADEGTYSVRVSNVLGDVTSQDVPLTLAQVPQCQVAACDALLGCHLSPASDGGACDDAYDCTTDDACQGGVCQGSPASPPEVAGVLLARSGGDAVITWSATANATSWSVLRGEVSTLPVGPGGADEMCLASAISVETSTDPEIPASGVAYWYLVRGDNACWRGDYGNQEYRGAFPTPRVSWTCP